MLVTHPATIAASLRRMLGVAAVVVLGTPVAAYATAPTVTAAAPSRVTLYAGVASTVRLTLSGSALDQITGVTVVDPRGTTIAGISAVLTGSASASRRTLEIRGNARVVAGAAYRLRLATLASKTSPGGATTIDLATALVQVDVSSGAGFSGHSYAVTPLMTCSQCHDLLAANVPDKFAWEATPVVPADAVIYGLPQEAVGATVAQIVRGQRVARSDGQKCTACHNPPSGGAAVPLTATTTQAFMCQNVAIFIQKPTKPQGLKQFFQNWKGRTCP